MNCVYFAINQILPINWLTELGKDKGIISQELIPIFLKHDYALVIAHKYPATEDMQLIRTEEECEHVFKELTNRDCILAGRNERTTHCWVKKNGIIYDELYEYDYDDLEIMEAWIPFRRIE